MQPSTINTHLYLVSNQATYNITPALDKKTQPQKVFLMVSPDKKTKAQHLQQVLKKDAGVIVELFPIQDPWDIEHIRTRTMELLEAISEDPTIDEIALNATGGTKVMSMACFETFLAYKKPIFHVHPHHDDLIWLYPEHWTKHQLADKAKLHHFLPAYGASVESKGKVSVLPAWKALTTHLINQIDTYSNPIRTLNWYAYQAKEKHSLSVSLQYNHQSWAAFQNMLDYFEAAGIVTMHRHQLRFVNEDARFFANGGWLEQHVYALIMEIRKNNAKIQDLAQSLEVARVGHKKNKRIYNELDVVALADNRLHIIECKTKQFKHVPDRQHSSGADTLYKLDTLKDLYGGLQAQGMLVSYLPLSAADKRRAHDLQIKVCDSQQLKNLRTTLMQWFSEPIK